MFVSSVDDIVLEPGKIKTKDLPVSWYLLPPC